MVIHEITIFSKIYSDFIIAQIFLSSFSPTCLYGILGYGSCDFSFECILDVMVFDEHGNAVCAMDFYCNTFLDLCMSHFFRYEMIFIGKREDVDEGRSGLLPSVQPLIFT